QFETECGVQIAVWRGRPAPDGIFDQLAGGFLPEHAPADMRARLRIEEPDRSGAGRRCRGWRGPGELRFEQLWLEHAAWNRVWPLETGGFGEDRGRYRQQRERTMTHVT